MSMIYVENTPNNTGVAVYGDHRDFEGLYEALHDIVGNEDEFLNHEMVRIRVLAVCYDLRHAMMGDREFEFVDNGMDDFKMRKLSVIAPDKNVYLKINVLWPELLFVMMALNDFILLYAKKKARVSYKSVLDRRNIWDASIAKADSPRLSSNHPTPAIKHPPPNRAKNTLNSRIPKPRRRLMLTKNTTTKASPPPRGVGTM
jgi:hypothetical protein